MGVDNLTGPTGSSPGSDACGDPAGGGTARAGRSPSDGSMKQEAARYVFHPSGVKYVTMRGRTVKSETAGTLGANQSFLPRPPRTSPPLGAAGQALLCLIVAGMRRPVKLNPEEKKGRSHAVHAACLHCRIRARCRARLERSPDPPGSPCARPRRWRSARRRLRPGGG